MTVGDTKMVKLRKRTYQKGYQLNKLRDRFDSVLAERDTYLNVLRDLPLLLTKLEQQFTPGYRNHAELVSIQKRIKRALKRGTTP